MSKEVTLNEIDEAIQKTEKLLRRLKIQRRNPGIPLHLAPKGKKPKSRTKSKPKSQSIQKKRDKLKNLGVDPRQLFGLDNDELSSLLKNPQLILQRENFRPPDDSPRRTPPSGFYNYPPDHNPNDPATLHRNTALTQLIDPVPQMLPRFG